MKKIVLLIVSIAFAFISNAQNQPKNIILFLVHGMGYNHVKAMELYSGSNSYMYRNFPVQYGVTTYPGFSETLDNPKQPEFYTGDYHNRKVWTEFEYADSMKIDEASACSAIATGIKPAYKSVAVDLDSSTLETILERAYSNGKSIGVVTNMPFSASGVASFAAHQPIVDSSQSIANQLLTQSNLSVLFGAGSPNDVIFPGNPDYSYISESDWTSLQNEDSVYANGNKVTDITHDGVADSWNFIDSYTELQTVTQNPVSRLCGIYGFTSLFPPFEDQIACAVKTLEQNQNGYVLVFEYNIVAEHSRMQDKQAMIQAMQLVDTLCYTIDTLLQSSNDINETLFIVSGTYEQGFLTSNEFDKTQGAPDYLIKQYKIDTGTEGQIPNMKFNSTTPTNHVVPMFAKGHGSELFANYIDEKDYVFGDYINNTEIGQVCFSLLPNPAQQISTPKNIILMINDGAGLNQIRSAEYYTGNLQAYRNFPVSLFHSTYPLITDEQSGNVTFWNNSYESNLAWTNKTYLRNRNNGTCSGASGTAIASGVKTYYYSLGVDINRNSLNSIARYAKSIGKSIGVASNIPHSDATPAVFIANNVSRNNAAEISRQMIIESQADVIIGGGHPEYDKHGVLKTTPNYTSFGGKDFWDDFIAGNTTYRTPSNSGWTSVQDIDNDGTPDPWTIIQDSSEFSGMMSGVTPKRLFGLIKVENSPQFYRDGLNKQEVHSNDLNRNMPELWQIARVALNVLDNNSNGFFVMIEGDAGDNASHLNYKGRLIEEQMRFDVTVDSVITWIEANGGWDENLLIITSDHETGLLCSPDLNSDSSMLAHYDIINNGIGQIPGMEFYATHHSNQLVPIFAKGAGAEILNSYADNQDYVRGKYLNNSEIGQAMFKLWGGNACERINVKPTIVDAIPDVTMYLNEDSTFIISNNFVEDNEDTELDYKVTTRPQWLTFNPENMSFSGTPSTVGNFTVKVVVTDGKTTGAGISVETTFIVHVLDRTDINKIMKPEFSLYPNPSKTNVIVSLPDIKGQIQIVSNSGNVIEKRKINSFQENFDVSNFVPGLYYIEIIENGVVIKKPLLIK